jgi:basic membrane protein A
VKKTFQMAAVGAAAALLLAACGDAPDETPATPGASATTPSGETTTEAASVDFKGCMVSDAGGFDDKSFNQSAYEGLVMAKSQLGIEMADAESTAETDFVPNIDSMVSQGCDLTITVGFLLADATKESAEKNTDAHFAIVDDASIDLPNVKPIVFNTSEAAFAAGYLAAGFSTTGTVATYGGLPIPSVTIFMDGFADGVAHYNEVKDADVKVLGWDKEAQEGTFANSFDDIAAGQNLTKSFIDAGADVILPVAGPLASGTATAAQQAGDVVFIGVDADWAETSPETADVTLTSVLKFMTPAVFGAIETTVGGEFSAEPYVGTLENDGLGLAPFHEFDAKVSDELKAEVEQVIEDIKSGTIEVTSPSAP